MIAEQVNWDQLPEYDNARTEYKIGQILRLNPARPKTVPVPT
jgi:hypothetical protein